MLDTVLLEQILRLFAVEDAIVVRGKDFDLNADLSDYPVAELFEVIDSFIFAGDHP